MNNLEETLKTFLLPDGNLMLANKVKGQCLLCCVVPFGLWVLKLIQLFCGSLCCSCANSFLCVNLCLSVNSRLSVNSCLCVLCVRSQTCCRLCCWPSRRSVVLCGGGCMRSCCSTAAVWPGCCPENCCTRVSPPVSSSSSPPTSGAHEDSMPLVRRRGRRVNSSLVVVIAESPAGAERGSSDILHIPALQSQPRAAPGDDGAADPRSDVLGVFVLTSDQVREEFHLQ